MFSELRPAEPEKPDAWECILSLSLLSSLDFLFSFSRCAPLFYERYFRQSSTAVAFRKGVLGPIISREYHYGYNAPVWASLSRSSSVHRWPVWMRQERVVAEERHKGNWRGGLKISTLLDRNRSNVVKRMRKCIPWFPASFIDVNKSLYRSVNLRVPSADPAAKLSQQKLVRALLLSCFPRCVVEISNRISIQAKSILNLRHYPRYTRQWFYCTLQHER